MNRYRISATSFLAYFVMSGMLAPIGIISGPMAEHFGLPVTEVTETFSWLTVGIFVGAVIALFVFAWLRIRTLLILVFSLLMGSLAMLPLATNLQAVMIPLGMVGVCCGIGLAAAALVISRTYNAARRASMLVITDGFFSVAGVVCAWSAVTLVGLGSPWWSGYVLVAGIAFAIVVLAVLSDFPESEHFSEPEPRLQEWPLSAWLCIAALCTYTLAQNTILWWLPQYAEHTLGADSQRAGGLVGQFWSGMFAAQIFVSWWVFKIGVPRLLPLAALSTLLLSIPLWWISDTQWLFVFAAVFGFMNLGLLKIAISYASHFTVVASPRLVSALLLGATTGTAISPWVSSQVVQVSDAGGALRFGSASYLVMCGLLLGAMWVAPVEAREENPAH